MKFISLTVILVFLLAFKSGETECIYTHRLSHSYQTLYPSPDKLFYHKIERINYSSDTTAIKIYFTHTFRGFKYFEFRQDLAIPLQTGKNEFIVKFSRDALEDTYSTLKIKVFAEEKTPAEFMIQMSFDPKTVQQRSGRKEDKDGFFIRKTDVLFLEVPPEDFMPSHISSDEKVFLKRLFGNRLNENKKESEKIKILAENILDLLEPYRGIPGNDTLSAVRQLMELKLHNQKFYCENIAEIFYNTCTAFDIPVRKIGLGNTYDTLADPAIFHSDYHTTVEVFDKDVKEWQLIDLSLYMLWVKKDGRKLNFIDFWYLLNSEQKTKLNICEYDPLIKKAVIHKVTESKRFPSIMDYYKQNQKFCFAHKKGYFTF